MKVMVIVKASASSEAGEMPSNELLTAMGAYNEELVQAGIMLAGEGLKPSSQGARVRFSGKNRTVIDGPFAETKELIAGYWIWKVHSIDEAIEWVKKCPNPTPEDCEIEIRPIFSADDFGEEFTPELREQEAALRAATLGLNKPTFQDRTESLIGGVNASYNNENRHDIPQHWERFVPYLEKIPGPLGTESYGVSWNSKPNGEFEYLTGVAVSTNTALPTEFVTLKLPAARYAVFTHSEHIMKIEETFGKIWSEWVPECGLTIDFAAPCFELYPEEFNPMTGMGGVEIWIPLAN